MSEVAAQIVRRKRRPGGNGAWRSRITARIPSDGWYWIAALSIATLAAALDAYRLGDSLRGFHVFNAGFYLLNGIKDSARGVFSPVVAPLDPNNPWVYPFILSLALRAFGASIAAARMVSIVAGAGSVLLTFALGRKLYNAKIGLVGATLFAVAPVEEIVARNIQVDEVMLLFMLAAMLAFVYAVAEGRPRTYALAGVLLGLAVMTKLPAVLLLPVFALWQTWRTRSAAWLKNKQTWVAAGAFAVTVLPWYAYQFFAGPEFAAAQQGLLGSGGWHGVRWIWEWVFKQWFWMLTPVLFAAAVAAVVWMALKRQPADKLLLSYLAVYGSFFLVFNFHAYYFLPLAPIATIGVGRWAYGLGARDARWAAAIALVGVTLVLPFTLLELEVKDYSSIPIAAVGDTLASKGIDPRTVVLWVDPELYGRIGPSADLLTYEIGLADVKQLTGRIPSAPAGKVNVVYAGKLVRPIPGFTEIGDLKGEYVWPTVFGYAIGNQPNNINFFNMPQLKAGPVPGPKFGWFRYPYEAKDAVLYLVTP